MKRFYRKRKISTVLFAIISLTLLFAFVPANISQGITFTTATEDIEQLIEDVKLLNLQNGFINCLDAKLDNAKRALNDLKENNDHSAISAMLSFIQVVEVQEGKFLTSEEAHDLIFKAGNILIKLGYGDVPLCPYCGQYHEPPCPYV